MIARDFLMLRSAHNETRVGPFGPNGSILLLLEFPLLLFRRAGADRLGKIILEFRTC